MNRRNVLASLVVAIASLLLAGCGPHWIVLTQAAPDPFLGQKTFGVMPIDMNGLRVGDKSEVEFLAEKDGDSRASFAADKVAINEEFAKSLISKAGEEGIQVVPATGPASAPFMVSPVVRWLEPGFYVGVAAKASEVRMLVRITAPDGRILDEIELRHHSGGYASGSRLRSDGTGLGRLVAEYLKTRVAPGQ